MCGWGIVFGGFCSQTSHFLLFSLLMKHPNSAQNSACSPKFCFEDFSLFETRHQWK